MTNRQFDEMVRRRTKTEVFTMNKQYEDKLSQALHAPAPPRPVRQITLRAAMVMLLVLSLLCGAAVAAINWSSRDVVTFKDKDGNPHVNETLAALAQPVNETFTGKALEINMIDAIHDGRSVTMSWQVKNVSSEQLYLLLDAYVGGEEIHSGIGIEAQEIYLEPGETRNSGLIGSLTTVEGETIDPASGEVSIRFSALRPTMEAIIEDDQPIEGIQYFMPYYIAYGEAIYNDDLKSTVFSGPEGRFTFKDLTPGMTNAEVLVSAGRMELIEALTCTVTLNKNTVVYSALPDGEPIEKDNGDYTLRVVKAELTPATAIFELERVFADEAALEAYTAYYDNRERFSWGFRFETEDKSPWVKNAEGYGGAGYPEQQPDGTWVWPYTALMLGVTELPDTLMVIPERNNPGEESYRMVEYPEEGIRLSFR